MWKRALWLFGIMLLAVAITTYVVEECNKVEVLALDLELGNVARKANQLEAMLQKEYEGIIETLELSTGEEDSIVEKRVNQTVEEVEPIVEEKVESISEKAEPIVEVKVESIVKKVEPTIIKENKVIEEEPVDNTAEQDVEKEIKIVVEVKDEQEEHLPTAVITSYGNVTEEAKMLQLINEERNKLGIQPLEYDVNLYTAAKVRCVEITQVFSHTRPDGSSCFSVSDLVHGENLCYSNSYDTQIAYQQFYNSDSHKANMLDPEFTKFACNRVVSDEFVYWVQVFGCN